ncbi:hypothetical protein SAMN05421812_115167 [Asanoa hainanensis]|uniref:ROS/MUCR transcriptional regulator protein n=1 Tax=Asanoa hainanensis TaxID=560556 RepID=A0A239P933_9ACTN|nr:hypothetical protein [Asanoa hainanensis]SNT63626.1 hypothetical protein SAMN05421812_115167 [Asanoa hainanensis]
MRPVGRLPDGTGYHAPLGRMVADGDRVCCHLCGRFFLSVASHIRVHGWSKADYLAAFGLELSNPLSGEATRKRRAASFTARFAVEPAIQRAQRLAHDRARSGALTAAAATAARGRRQPAERRAKTLRTLAGISRAARAEGTRRAAADRMARVAAGVADRFGFADFPSYVADRLRRGASMAAISREAGLHKDWVSRQLAAVAPGVVPPLRADARLRPAALAHGFGDTAGYLRARHVDEHRTVSAIALEAGVTATTVHAALRHHGLRPVAHATKRHLADARAAAVAEAFGYPTLVAYIAARRSVPRSWRDIAAECGLPETTLRRHAAAATT